MHLNDKLAEFVYEELPPSAMAEARNHVSACAECKTRVEEFERIHLALKAMPDEDLPRRVVVARQGEHSRRLRSRPLRWLAPVGVAVAAVLALALVGPVHLDWHDSQFTVAFGTQPARSPATAAVESELTQLRLQVAYLNEIQEQLVAYTYQNGSDIQRLAQKSQNSGD
jgi:anti-sigma factor RsiW